MTTIEQAIEQDPIGMGLNILEYIVYLDAGKHVTAYKKVATDKKWWEFWKDSYAIEERELTPVEQAVKGKDFVSDYTRTEPYSSLLKRIKRFAIKTTLVKIDNHEEFLDLATDVLYDCPHGEKLFTYEDMTKFFEEV